MNYVNHIKVKVKSNIFKSSNKSSFYKFCIYIYFKYFFIYIKMSKNSSAKYYPENKKALPKKNL